MTSTPAPAEAVRSLSLSALDWCFVNTEAGLIAEPEELGDHDLSWMRIRGLGPVASMLEPEAYHYLDDYDWWFQGRFSFPDTERNGRSYLRLGGLASVARVWLNNKLILQSDNMFVSHSLDVTSLLQENNELLICCQSLSAHLSARRPRPRWKTRLVNNQQLRWVRTSLLGRIPGWTPAVPIVGPWREIALEQVHNFELLASRLTTSGEYPDLFLQSSFSIRGLSEDYSLERASLELGGLRVELSVDAGEKDQVFHLSGGADISQLEAWWPHTHGQPALHDCALVLHTDKGDQRFGLGKRGFKQLKLVQGSASPGLSVNGEPVFCRGACWTINDIRRLDGDEAELRAALLLARDAGMNMLRIGGTMVYEADRFYQLCDELGIMVWQDFMFANMDYPVDDEAFHQNIVAEVTGQLQRLSSYACISVYCGSSEVQQQAAMLGLSKELWSNTFFDQELPALCEESHPGIPYFASTPTGGALPFHVNEGLSHYYGVGAYKRALSDVALANVKFTPETLGFSHVPDALTIDRMFNGDRPVMHDPKWKAGVPRDSGAGWDFEDIRDYYLGLLYDVDPVQLRCHDPDRYLALSRVVTGEVIYRVFAHWRSAASPCMGALIWFYKDLVPGAGWGLIDVYNQPKAVYFAAKRAFVSLGVFIEDKGLDGLYLHMVNEKAAEVDVTLQLEAYGQGNTTTLQASTPLTLEQHQNVSLSVDELLGYFTDLGYAYRFGAVQHQVVIARLIDSKSGAFIDDDCFFPVTHSLVQQKDVRMDITVREDQGGERYLQLLCSHFLQSVNLQLKYQDVADNYFHLAPNTLREVRLIEQQAESQPVKGYLEALNLTDMIKVR